MSLVVLRVVLLLVLVLIPSLRSWTVCPWMFRIVVQRRLPLLTRLVSLRQVAVLFTLVVRRTEVRCRGLSFLVGRLSATRCIELSAGAVRLSASLLPAGVCTGCLH